MLTVDAYNYRTRVSGWTLLKKMDPSCRITSPASNKKLVASGAELQITPEIIEELGQLNWTWCPVEREWTWIARQPTHLEVLRLTITERAAGRALISKIDANYRILCFRANVMVIHLSTNLSDSDLKSLLSLGWRCSPISFVCYHRVDEPTQLPMACLRSAEAGVFSFTPYLSELTTTKYVDNRLTVRPGIPLHTVDELLVTSAGWIPHDDESYSFTFDQPPLKVRIDTLLAALSFSAQLEYTDVNGTEDHD